MPLHRLTHVTVGVPDVAAALGFYTELGLSPTGPAALATTDGGEQLRLVESPRRRLVEIGVGVGGPDDLDRVERQLGRLGVPATRTGDGRAVHTADPVAGVAVAVSVAPPITATPVALPPLNGPGRVERTGQRSAVLTREGPVRPRKLSHAVYGSPDVEASERFFVEGLGFKISDRIPGVGAFLRCSTDHHNVLVQRAPVPFLHHTSWYVDDVDEIGRGATAMLAADPSRHVWGLGRHFIGSNFFWYLRDPAGNFAEYASDLDVIVDDELWTPEQIGGLAALYAWGPPVPPAFIAPDDLADLMAGA